ncbi:hypothetical protein LCGC14_2581680 [marine sediment metagenome]|uniref:Uncharacterized protein n=1 Tax=marine sediment metagenome TaxID=412755 RepID=A0A0F9AEN2_9ZZZZ
MEFLHSILRQNVTESDGLMTVDLPVNPLSHIILTTQVLNLTANTKATLAQILSAIEKVEVLFEGSAIMSMDGEDLFALNCVLLGKEPWQQNVINTENATRSISLMIPFGRTLYDPNECLFATSKGELQLQITYDIADTGYDGLVSQIETVELPEATPSRHIKVTKLTKTLTSGADNDIDLPIGLPYAGILLRSATVPTGTADTTTIDKVKLLANNVQKMYAETNWESLHGMLMNRLSPAGAWGEKLHLENTATGYTANADTDAEEQDDTDISNYSFMDFTPNGKDDFIFPSAGLSRFHLRINAGDGGIADILPVQLAPSQ